MIGELLGGLVDKQKIIKEYLENAIEDTAEEMNISPDELFIMIKPIKKDTNEFKVYLYKAKGPEYIREMALKEFIDTNPDHPLTGNAQYWFAETFYIRQLYHDAAAAYLDGYQKYPKNKKAPQNLLKLGIVLSELGEKEQGCLMLTGLPKQYPKAAKSIIQKAKNETSKFKCKKS